MRYLMVLLIIALLGSEIALAASMGGGLPWESPLSSIKDSLTGPVAGAISLIAIVVAGAVLIFGGDFSAFVRALINVVLVISILVGASSLLTHLFGVSGAVISKEQLLLLHQPGER